MPEQPFGGAFGPLEELVGKLFAGLESGFVDDRPDEARAEQRRPRTEPRRPRAATHRLDRHGRDLTAAAGLGRLDPVVGRDDEIDQVLEVLARRTKNNPVLVGDPGVGKTAIVEGIAQRVVTGAVPAALRHVRVVALDLAGMVAGTKYRGEFEQRLTAVIEEVVAAERSVVVFVDELHAVVGAGAAEGGAMDAGTILKPALARGDLQLIGATTAEDYRRHIEKDPALERRFEPVRVAEPSVEQAVEILRGLRPRYEQHHGVTISDAALEAAARLSHRYVRDRFLPDKAIDLLDRAGARLHLRVVAPTAGHDAVVRRVEQLTRARAVAVDAEEYERADLLQRELDRARAELAATEATAAAHRPELTAAEVAEAVSRSTGIPVARLSATDRDQLLYLEDRLRRRVVGQEEAVEAVADAVRQGRVGLAHPHRPVGSFLFLGPTGVGKTELARALAETLFGSEDRLVRFDMSEFADASSLSRLVGAAPGYVGYDDAGQLTAAVRRAPYSVVLLDEIEKAHRDVTGTLLQVLDAGRLTDAHGRPADFTHAVVIMTSNLGAEQILRAEQTADVREPVLALARQHLRPEFVNRVDEVVLFSGLQPTDLRRITEMLLGQTRERLRAQGVRLKVSDAAVGWLADRGHRPEHGARPLRRTIGRELDRRLARMLLAGEVEPGQRVVVDANGGDGALRLRVTDG
jgi:ATP-dependent Clp protease ATP-binding subunit ClpC